MGDIQFYRDSDLPFFELKKSSKSELSYKPHTHQEYSLAIIDYGKISFWYEGKKTEIYPQTILLLPPNLIHACNPVQQKEWQYKMLFINDTWVQGFNKSNYSLVFNEPIIWHATDKSFHIINQLLGNLASSINHLEKEANISTILNQIMKHNKGSYNITHRQEKPKVKIIQEYLHSHFLEGITLDQLEQISGLNKFRIIRMFKETFSIPPHTYQTLLRINYSKEELRKQRAVMEVALEAGFYDQSHFIKVFKGYTGITPHKYQTQIK